MTLENPSTTDGLAGETFLCLIGDQFARQKWGDRYFYDLGHQEGSFNLGNIFNFIIDFFFIHMYIFSKNLLHSMTQNIKK